MQNTEENSGEKRKDLIKVMLLCRSRISKTTLKTGAQARIFTSKIRFKMKVIFTKVYYRSNLEKLDKKRILMMRMLPKAFDSTSWGINKN